MMEPMATDDHPTPLVGRDDELDQLAALLGVPETPGGSGFVLLGGDAGVGKTRLLHDLRERAYRSGRWDVVGHCVDFGDSALPYLPFTEIVGRLLAESPALVGPLVAESPALDRLLPRQRVRGAGAGATLTSAARDRESGDRAAEARSSRADIFEGLHRLLERLSRTTPLLVVVEDAHWADRSTRELLTFLFVRGFEGPVSLVVSYRSDDVHRRHPLRTALAEWSRIPTVHRLQLAPLPDHDVRALVRVLHPDPLQEKDIQTILTRAEGNAFFAEELLGATQLPGRSLPADLADLLLVRLDRLDETTRSVVRAAAVAGRRVPHRLLAQVVEHGSADLDHAVRQAVDSHVLVPGRDDTYAFRHALLAEAVYDDLLPGERVRLHAAYVAALQEGEVPGTAAELARHARAAHDTGTAVRASIEAGDEAMRVGAPQEAARHYEVALELLGAEGAGGSEGSEGSDDVELVLRASDALLAAGHPHRAVKLLCARLGRLPGGAQDEARASLLVGLASASFLVDTGIDPLEATGEAMRLVPEGPATPLRAQVLNAHAKATAYRLGGEEAMRFATAALDAARCLGLPRVAAEAAMTLAKIDDLTGDRTAARARLERVVEQARVEGDIDAELRGLHQLGGIWWGTGEFGAAREAYLLADRRARDSGRPWAPYGLDGRALGALAAYVMGDWDEAVRLVDVSRQSPSPSAEALLAAVELYVAAGRGSDAGLRLVAATRPWWSRDGMTGLLSAGAAIDLYGDRHDVDAAVAAHDEVVGALERLWPGTTAWVQVRLSALVLGQLAGQASRTARSSLDGLGRRGERFVVAASRLWEQWSTAGPTRVEARAWRARVDAEHLRLRWLTGVDAPGEDALVASWRACVRAFEELGHEFEVARSRARLATVLRATGAGEESRRVADLARATATRLGAEPLLTELRTLGGSGRHDEAARPRGAPLTAREDEVLALVAQGLSNAQIGRQLFISAKTVSVHVSNILAKLGASGRTEAVALARRSGILTE